jgi:hypothetical protein
MMQWFKRRLSIHRILLLVSLVMLLLPLGSLHFLKLYESALIRQTESELIAQAAFISAIYRQEMSGLLGPKRVAYGIPMLRKSDHRAYFQPVPATLDLAKAKVHPPRPNGIRQRRGADPLARLAGARVIRCTADDPVRDEGAGLSRRRDRGAAGTGLVVCASLRSAQCLAG